MLTCNRSPVRAVTPLQIGSVNIDFPVVQAALSGYSDAPMRIVARRLGAPYTLCEVMLDRFLIEAKKSRKNKRFLHVADEEHPVGGQLMGADPAQFGLAALRLVQSGFDVIDINFGCPVKKVLGRCRGGFHLSQPEIALEIVARVREAVPPQIPVTVKMRRSLDDTSASRDKFLTIFDGAYRLGVAAITVHGRTVAQRYDGPSNWDALREIKRHAGTRIVLGSGDLFTAASCLDMMRFTGVDGVTVARGAIGNPWIFQQARALAAGEPLPAAPSLHEQRAVLAEHFRLAADVYGPEQACSKMRKFGIQYSRLHPSSTRVRDAFIRVRQPSDWQQVLDNWYREDRPGCHPFVDEPPPIRTNTDAHRETAGPADHTAS